MALKNLYPLIQKEKIGDLDFITKLLMCFLYNLHFAHTKGSEVFRGLRKTNLDYLERRIFSFSKDCYNAYFC